MKPRIIGTGWAVPANIRTNEDPIFKCVKEKYPKQDMFEGYSQRHVLGPNETLMDIMVPAAKMALQKAGKKPEDVDILLGIGSISEYIQPNELSKLHQELKLPQSTWVIPVGNDYSNYASSLLIADGLLRAHRAKTILICTGDNWTSNVDYCTPQSISAADGAGAAVMALSEDADKWYVADQQTVTISANYGAMFTKANPVVPQPANGPLYTAPFFQITADGLQDFKSFGMETALEATKILLKRNNLTGSDISFMPHQTSASLIDYWCANLPLSQGQVLSTLSTFANTTVACHAMNLAWFEEQGTIAKDNLVMMALGPDMHCNAMLLKRY